MIITLLEIGLSNAVVASLLALVAFVVTKRMRPQWALAVWLLVLAKLLMPPLLTVPLASLRASAPGEEPAEFVFWNQAEHPIAFSTEASVLVPEAQFEPLPITEAVVETPAKTVTIPALLLAAWGIGTVCWSVLAVRRIHGFSTLIKHTQVAPRAIQAEIDALAAEIGLRCAPVLRVTRRRIAPLVWAFSRRSTILLPEELVELLSPDERRALLLHELTHLRRRDYLAKLLELAAVAVYWWLPTAWWARRQADRATEGCCDAEVVTRLTGDARSYASALVKTIDYLSESTQPLPLGASGFSQFGLVSRRIEMILQPLPVRGVSWKSRLAIVALCLLVLPVSVRSLWAEPLAAEIDAAASSPVSPAAEPSSPPPAETDDERSAQQKADREYVPTRADDDAPTIQIKGSEDASLPVGLIYAQHTARVKAFMKEYFSEESLQRAKGELASLEQKADEKTQQKMIAIRDAHRGQLEIRQTAFASGDLPVEELIETQRELSDRESALAGAICPETWSGEVLRMQANYIVAFDAVNRARKTWQEAHKRSGTAGTTDDFATESLAREHFYRCKQQCQNVAQAALGDFGQLAWQENLERDMATEMQAAQGAEWRTFSITGSTTVGATLTKLDPPSDEEVLRALHRKLFSEGRSPAKGDIKVVKELRATYVDDPREHAKVGQAQRHHAFYKCTVGYVELGDKQTIEVFYIDHNHLHRFDKTPQQAHAGEPEAEAKQSEAAPAGGEFISSAGQGKDWNSSEAVIVDKAEFEAKTRSLALDVQESSALANTNTKRRDAAARQFKAMEAAYKAGTVTIDQLLEAQRRHSEAQVTYYQTILQADSESAEHRRLLHEANIVVATEAMTSARSTWQAVYAKYRQGSPGGEASVEAQAREQFYQFKQQFEHAKRGYEEELERQSNSLKQPTSQRSPQPNAKTENRHGDELNRVSIVGSVTSGDKLTVLDPPSDEEVLHAMATKVISERRSLPGKQIRIVKELVATYTDPPKFYPSISGKARRHHAHYKCTVVYEGPQGKLGEEVVYVDHTHLHRKVDSRTFDEFQSGSLRYRLSRGFTKQVVQFRHYQLQLAREKAKLADLKRQIVDTPTPEQQTELSRLEMRVAARQQELDAAAGTILQSALSPVAPLSGTSYWVGPER